MISEIRHDRNHEDIFYLGDIHGNFNYIQYMVSRGMTDSVIVQVGDFQVGFYEKAEKDSLGWLNKTLKKNNVFLYAIRGNHDRIFKFKNQWEYSNIFFIEDWTVLNLVVANEPRRILCVGGAISVDRISKANRGMWESKEAVRYIGLEDLNMLNNINTIVTHTSPKFLPPYQMAPIVYDCARLDEKLIEDIQNERYEMDYMFTVIINNNEATLEDWYYGHFHFSEKTLYRGILCRLLGIGEFS